MENFKDILVYEKFEKICFFRKIQRHFCFFEVSNSFLEKFKEIFVFLKILKLFIFWKFQGNSWFAENFRFLKFLNVLVFWKILMNLFWKFQRDFDFWKFSFFWKIRIKLFLRKNSKKYLLLENFQVFKRIVQGNSCFWRKFSIFEIRSSDFFQNFN